MAQGDNSPGMSRLAGVIREMGGKRAGGPVFDFGTIQQNGGLLTDSYPIMIPKSDYVICRHLKSRTATTSETSSHTHTVNTQQGLSAGSRVLVAWVGNDAVVIDVVLNASSVL